MIFQCPNCDKKVKASSFKPGQFVKCPHCKEKIEVPGDEPEVDEIEEPEVPDEEIDDSESETDDDIDEVPDISEDDEIDEPKTALTARSSLTPTEKKPIPWLDYLTFRKLFPPFLMQVIFVVLVLLALINGIRIMDAEDFLTGLLYFFENVVVAVIICEAAVLLTRISDFLFEFKNSKTNNIE